MSLDIVVNYKDKGSISKKMTDYKTPAVPHEGDAIYEYFVPVPEHLKDFVTTGMRTGVDISQKKHVMILASRCPKCEDIQIACRKHINQFVRGCLTCQTIAHIQIEHNNDEYPE